jgi:hypothetical protein
MVNKASRAIVPLIHTLNQLINNMSSCCARAYRKEIMYSRKMEGEGVVGRMGG